MSVISLDAFKQLDDATISALLKYIEEWPWEFHDADIDHQTAAMYLKDISLKDISSKDIRITKQAEYRRRLFDLELFKDFRQNERARSTSVNHWPANLSKKEVALCKIQMITTLFNICKSNAKTQVEGADLVNIIEGLLESIKSSVYKWKWDDTKPKEVWPGIDPAAADILNTLFKTFRKNYLKDLAVR
jgi:hypothetical protein